MDCRDDFNCRAAEAPHTEAYLWEHIIGLCQALHARRIVDIGCGNGALCRELAGHGYEVVGCEPSAESLHFAQLGASGLVFHRLGVDDDPSVIGNENFDVAIATEVIEHVLKPFNLPRFAKQLLRPGGHLILSTPYHGYLKNLILALTNRWDAHLSPFWDGGHIKFWSVQDPVPIVERKRFSCRSVYRSGSITFSLEEHDRGCTETSFRVVARSVSVQR